MKSYIFNLLFFTLIFCAPILANTSGPGENGGANTEKLEEPNTVHARVDLNFKTIKRDGKAEFFWTTNPAEGRQKYIVQTSKDGKRYEDISIVFSQGSEIGDIFYDFYVVPFDIHKWYRVKMIDAEGNIKVTKAVKM